MSLVVPPDVEQLIARQVAMGLYESSEDVLRSAVQALVERDDDLAAIQESIREWQSGAKGIPLDDAMRMLGEKYGFDMA